MQDGTTIATVKQDTPNKDGASGFRLTDRDYEIFKFLYDQKFASLETIYFRFFDQRESCDEPIPEQMPSARQRLGILKRAGFVKTEKVYSEAKSVYLLAKVGFKALCARDPKLTYGPPIQSVDFRNFEHDTRVNIVRVALEKKGKTLKWYPERRIRIAGFVSKDVGEPLSDSVVPDAIFLSSKGKRVALELELSIRKKSRFRFKVDELEKAMRGSSPLIHQVIFVVCTAALRRDLTEIIGGRRNFIIEDYSHFVESLYPRTVTPQLIEEPVHVGEE